MFGRTNWKVTGHVGKEPVMMALVNDITLEISPDIDGGVNLWVGDDKYGPYDNYIKAQTAAENLPFLKENLMTKREVEIKVLKKLRQNGLINEDAAKALITKKKLHEEGSVLNGRTNSTSGTWASKAQQYESEYSGTVLGYESTWDKSQDGRPIVYYVSEALVPETYSISSGILTGTNHLENETEVLDDWLADNEAALEIAYKMATDENYDAYPADSDE